MGDNILDIISESSVFKRFFELKTYDLRFRKFDGMMSPVINREIFHAKDAVIILPYDPLLDKVVMVEQIRFASALCGREVYHIEPPAGLIEKGDAPEETARRELREETGLKALDMIVIAAYMPSPAIVTEYLTSFCARIDAGKAVKFGGLEDENENLRVHVFDYAEVVAMLEKGVFKNASTIIALQWLVINRESLRKKWR